MEWRDARWIGYVLAALIWAVLLSVCASAMPAGEGGGSLVQRRLSASERLVRPPAASSERVHIYSGGSESARVFWDEPAAGRVHITIELPEEEPDLSEVLPGDAFAPVLPEE